MNIKLKKINKYYYDQGKSTKGLENVSLEFDTDGSFVVITGESGAGKSTLIKVITGIEDYDEGEIYFDDVPLASLTAKEKQQIYTDNISFVFQDYNLVESITATENINLALLKQGKTINEVRVLSEEALKKVGLAKQKKMRVSKLSGGERQRVAIARSLALNTPVIVFDEPTGNLDNETSRQIIDLIEEISKDKLILYVTHDYEIVEKSVTRHIVLADSHVVKDVKVKKANSSYEATKARITNTKFPFSSYLYSTYLIGFKRIGRLLATLLVLIFAYASILGSYYGFATSIVFAGSFTGSNFAVSSFAMGNEITNRKNTLDEPELTFEAEHYTDYGNQLTRADVYVVSETLNEETYDENDLSYMRDYSDLEVQVLPYYQGKTELIYGDESTENQVGLYIPSYISDTGYFMGELTDYILPNDIKLSLFTSSVDTDSIDAMPETKITNVYKYDNVENDTGKYYLVLSPSLIDELREYETNVYDLVPLHNLSIPSNDLTDSDLFVKTSDGTTLLNNEDAITDSLSESYGTSLFLPEEMKDTDFTIEYKNLEIPQSAFDIKYQTGADTTLFKAYVPCVTKMLKEQKILTTTYFKDSSTALAQYNLIKDDFPRVYCKARNTTDPNYALNIMESASVLRVGYFVGFCFINLGILVVAAVIKLILNRFYYRKSYDQQVLGYIGYSNRDIVIVNLLEFAALFIVSTAIVYGLFIPLVPNAAAIFSANVWLVILGIIINISAAIFFALPNRKKEK